MALARSVTSLAEAASPKECRGGTTHRASHRLRVGRRGLEELENPTFSRLRGGADRSLVDKDAVLCANNAEGQDRARANGKTSNAEGPGLLTSTRVPTQ